MRLQIEADIFVAAGGQPFLPNLVVFVSGVLGGPGWRVSHRSPDNYAGGCKPWGAVRQEYGFARPLHRRGATSKGDGGYRAIQVGTHGPAIIPVLR